MLMLIVIWNVCYGMEMKTDVWNYIVCCVVPCYILSVQNKRLYWFDLIETLFAHTNIHTHFYIFISFSFFWSLNTSGSLTITEPKSCIYLWKTFFCFSVEELQQNNSIMWSANYSYKIVLIWNERTSMWRVNEPNVWFNDLTSVQTYFAWRLIGDWRVLNF